MANLATLLKDILIKEDKITVPGLGTLETTYQPAQLDEKTGVIHPPTKLVRLNASKPSDPDGKLAAAIAALGVPEQEAAAMIEQFVSGVAKKLSENSTVAIDGVGVIFRNESGEPDLKPVVSKLSIDNYGLDTEEIEPVSAEERVAAAAAIETARSNGGRTIKGASQETKTTTTKTTTTKTVTTTSKKKEDPEKKNGLLKALLIILPIVAILAILFVIFKDKIMGTEPSSAQSAAVDMPKQDTKQSEDPSAGGTQGQAEKSDAHSKPQQGTADPDLAILAGEGFANVQPQDLGAKYKKYYLIGGSFKDKSKANQEKRRLGASDLLHVDGSDLYRVIFVGTDSAQEVVDVYRKTIDRGIPSSNIWLLKNSKNNK